MADKNKLRDMLTAIIDGNDEQSRVSFHGYITGKMQQLLGRAPAEPAAEVTPPANNDAATPEK